MAQNVTQYCHVCQSQTMSGPPVIQLSMFDGPSMLWVNWPVVDTMAFFTVNFAHLHYNVIQHGCEATSG